MKEKLRALFDARTTWAALGLVAGTIWGGVGVHIVNTIGAVVMAVL